MLDRPERERVTPAGLDALEAALGAATEPVVSLTGAGSAFCARADLSVVDSVNRSLSGRVLDAGKAQQVGLLSRVDKSRTVTLPDSDPMATRTIKERLHDTAPADEQVSSVSVSCERR